MKRDLFFLVGSFLSYTTGAFLARFKTARFDLIPFVLGLVILGLGYIIRSLLEHLSTNKINPYAKLSYAKQDRKTSFLLLTIVLFMGVFFVLYVLLQQNILIGVNLIFISLIFVLFLLPLSRFGKILQHSYDLIIEALLVSPLFFLLASGLQSRNPEGIDFLLSLPVFFLFIASSIAWRFPDYGKQTTNSPKTLIDQIGWENSIRLHNSIILLAILSFSLYLIITKTFAIYWWVLLSSIISLLEIFLLNRISMGMKPNWALLRVTAFLQLFTFLYLLFLPTL